MIKIIYTEKNDKKDFPYDSNFEIVLDQDITSTAAIEVFIKMLNVATYHVNAETIEKLAQELKEKYGNSRIV